MIVLIDNYDSFTFNLVHYLGGLGADVVVHRNDKISVADVMAAEPDAIVLSPGPCTPNEAGICLDLIGKAAVHHSDPRRLPRPSGDRPGLRRQGGARAVPVHGKLSEIRHTGTGVFRGINGPFKATRYHSLVVERASMPRELTVTAETDDGLVMGLVHASLPVHGVQFHPESIASEHGHLMLKNFLDLAAAWNAQRGRRASAATRARAAARGELRAQSMADDFKALIAKVATGASLTREEAATAFDRMMSGEATPSQMGGLLMALRVRGETVDEITGAVTTMRAKMLGVKAPPDAIDVVGTGGDASGSYNISTCAAFIVAGAGVPVAKHGNRALSSHSGAADVLQRARRQDRSQRRAGRPLHPRGRHRLHVRAGASSGDEERRPDPRRARHPHHLQSARAAVEPGERQAPDGRHVLQALDRADGAGAGQSRLGMRLGGARLRRARRDHHLRARPAWPRWRTARSAPSRSRRRMPACRAPSPRRCAAAMPTHNAKALLDVLKGKPGPFRDVAILNAAAALIVAGKAKDLKEGAALAAKSIDSGEAEGRLDRLIAVSERRGGCERGRHPRQDRSLQARGDRGGQARASARRA